MAALRIVFMGTPDLAGTCLEALLREPGFDIAAVVTQPDRPKGRDLKLQPSPVKEIALRAGKPVLQPLKARDEQFIAELKSFSPQLIAVAAFGQILPQPILDLPKFGCLNVHTSLLPKYRGAAPIQWAILNGDAETGVTIMKMDAGLDTGDMLAKQTTTISDADNSQTLHDRLAKLGGELLVKTIPDYIAGRITPEPQPEDGATYARKIRKEDGRLDWELPARALWNRLRAFTPWPGVFTFLPGESAPQLLKVWQAEVASGNGASGQILRADKTGILVACGDEALKLTVVQREGGRRVTAQEFLAGHPLTAGIHLS